MGDASQANQRIHLLITKHMITIMKVQTKLHGLVQPTLSSPRSGTAIAGCASTLVLLGKPARRLVTLADGATHAAARGWVLM